MLSTKHQQMMACQFDNQSLFKPVLHVEKVTDIKTPSLDDVLLHFRSFKLVENIYADTEIFDPEALNNHHPLTAYTVGGKILVTPKVCLLH